MRPIEKTRVCTEDSEEKLPLAHHHQLSKANGVKYVGGKTHKDDERKSQDSLLFTWGEIHTYKMGSSRYAFAGRTIVNCRQVRVSKDRRDGGSRMQNYAHAFCSNSKLSTVDVHTDDVISEMRKNHAFLVTSLPWP